WIGQLRLDWDYRKDLATNPAYDKDAGIYTPRAASTPCACEQPHPMGATEWSGINQPITLTYRNGTEGMGNVLLRGFQLADMLTSLGSPVPIRVQALENLYRAKPRGQIVIVLKTAVRLKSEPILRAFNRWGNTVLYDVVDGLVPARIESLCESYICSSLTEERDRRSRGYQTIVSLQSPDQRTPAHPFERREFSHAYYGLPENALHLDTLPELHPVNFSEMPPHRSPKPLPSALDGLRRYSHHYSVRAWNDRDGFKPMMKGFFAARLGAVVIASAEDEESRLILGDDYPYLAASSALEDVQAIIEYAQHTHLGPEWERAVATMQELRQMSCPVKTAQDLVAGLRKLAH
ncbi:MAG: hypothetical protein WD400_04345, partial [Pontimonas sp.]